MNTLVEKSLGLIIFVGLILPFTFGLYVSYTKAGEFNNVTTELTQMLKEDGNYKGTKISQTEIDKAYAQGGSTEVDKLMKNNNSTQAFGYLHNPVATHDGRSTKGLNDFGYQATILYLNGEKVKLKGNKLVPDVTNNNLDYNGVELSKDVNINFDTGDKVVVSYDYKLDRSEKGFGVLGWNPHYEKTVEFTVYKRTN